MDLLDDADTARTQLDFPVVYASGQGRHRVSLTSPANGAMPEGDDLEPLFQTILEHDPGADVRPRTRRCRRTSPTSTPRPFLGRLALLPGPRGHHAARASTVAWMPPRRLDQERQDHRAAHHRGASSASPAETAGPGDIVAVAGIPDITIGETLADPDDPRRAAADHGRRARHLDDDRHQHLAAGRPGQGRQGHRPPGQGPPRPRARSATSRSGSCRPSAPTPGRCRAVASSRWPSSSSRCAARASSSPSASRRWSPARSTARCTSRSSA